MSSTEGLYNNVGIQALAILFVLQRSEALPISKTLLISPIIAHKEMLKYLSNGNVKIQGVEKLVIEKTSFFTNFNNRFYDHLCGTINAVQFLHEVEAIAFDGQMIEVKLGSEPVIIGKEAGKRALKIQKSASNIAKILEASAEDLYLNFRIEL